MQAAETLYGKQKTILITGASSGIGEALAVHLAQYGGRIALVARREDRLAQVADRVRSAGGTALVSVADVGDYDAVKLAHQQISSAFGSIDVAFLNAGVDKPVVITRYRAADVAHVMAVNVLGVSNWLEFLLPHMVQSNSGAIVGISSLSALRGLPGHGPYSASKACMSNLLEALRVEGKSHGIQVSVVEPGFIRSEMTAKNRFPMPFLVEAEDAARQICEAVADGEAFIRFPWQITAAMKIMRSLPRGIYERVGAELLRRGT